MPLVRNSEGRFVVQEASGKELLLPDARSPLPGGVLARTFTSINDLPSAGSAASGRRESRGDLADRRTGTWREAVLQPPRLSTMRLAAATPPPAREEASSPAELRQRLATLDERLGGAPPGGRPGTPRRGAPATPTTRGSSPQELPLEMSASLDRVRGSLLAIGSKFHDLDRVVEDDARRRRELEQQGLREVTLMLSKLEKSLRVEAERREEAEQQVERTVEKLIEDMIGRVQSKLSDRFLSLQRSVVALSERCSHLERGIGQFKGTLPTKLTVETEALRQVMCALHAGFVADAKQAIERDERLGQSLQETVDAVEKGCAQELLQLERRVETLQGSLSDIQAVEDSREARSRKAAVLGHISAIQEGLAEERRAREEADDRVVQAINEYADQFQRTMRMANA